MIARRTGDSRVGINFYQDSSVVSIPFERTPPVRPYQSCCATRHRTGGRGDGSISFLATSITRPYELLLAALGTCTSMTGGEVREDEELAARECEPRTFENSSDELSELRRRLVTRPVTAPNRRRS